MLRPLFAFALVLLLTLNAVAESKDFQARLPHNWHQWRGPHANGVALVGNPPLEWSETKNIKWKLEVAGDSTSTPIIWGDRLFLLSAIETDQKGDPAPQPAAAGRGRGPAPSNVYQFVLLCLDRNTGKVLWQQVAREEVPHEGHHQDGSFAAGSPMTDGQYIYASFGSRGIYCYDFDGKQIWARDLGKMSTRNGFGEGTSPVVRGDTVVVNWDHESGSYVIALDAKTGETKWKTPRDEQTTWATPLVVDHDGRTQVILNGAKRVRSYDLATGELIWECGGQAANPIPSPVTDGQLAFAMTGYRGFALYAIPLTAQGDITDTDRIAWKKTQGTPYVPSPLLVDGKLYFLQSNNGIVSSLDAKTGDPLIDRKRLEGIDNIYASPVAVGDRIYFTSRGGNTVVVKKGADLEILASNQLDDRVDASFAIVGDQIYVRGRKKLYCIATQ